MDTKSLNAKARLVSAIVAAHNEAIKAGVKDVIPTIIETIEAKKEIELFLSRK